MGGNGKVSYSGGGGGGYTQAGAPLSAFAVASLNRGTASGTTTEAAIERFREQTMNAGVEYSAYIDDYGYVHSLASSGKPGETGVAPIASVANERGVSTVIHNHPHGGDRIWGGPFSDADLMYIVNAYNATGGSVNRMVATSNEGTYSARVTRRVSVSEAAAAASRADAAVRSMGTFRSERAMWRAVNDAYTREFANIGVNITFTGQNSRSSRLVTQQIGNY